MKTLRGILVVLCLAAVAYGLSGVLIVAPGEVVVVRRLGRVQPRPLAPGLHWCWPAGFDQTVRVRTSAVRRLEVGLVGTPGPELNADSGEYMSGDWNVLRAVGIVQYRVADPVAFTLRMGGLEPMLARMAEASLNRSLSRMAICFLFRSRMPAMRTRG